VLTLLISRFQEPSACYLQGLYPDVLRGVFDNLKSSNPEELLQQHYSEQQDAEDREDKSAIPWLVKHDHISACRQILRSNNQLIFGLKNNAQSIIPAPIIELYFFLVSSWIGLI
jgi:hypothetical protein